MKLYKVLREENGKLISPYQSYEYEIGKRLICKDFDENPDTNDGCSRGYYATDVDGLIYTFRDLPGYVVYECEVGGKKVEINQFKRRYEWIELTRQVPPDEIKKLASEWEPKVGYKMAEALFPVNPLKIPRTGPVTEEEKGLLARWDSVIANVRDSVWDSVRDSVWDSVWDNVWDSVRDSVWDSVRASVWDSVWAYISSLFPGIQKWKYIDHPPGQNPFQPGIDLWLAGLVPSFDGKNWRLRAGKKAKIVYKWEA